MRDPLESVDYSISTGLNPLVYSHSSIASLEFLGNYLSNPDNDFEGSTVQYYLDAAKDYKERMKILKEQEKKIDEYTELLMKKREAV